MPNNIPIIAIDGGSGVGKSSTAKALAEALDFLHVDTGSHYRALTCSFQAAGIPYDDEEAIKHALAHWSIDSRLEGRVSHILINSHPFSFEQLKSTAVNADVSYYAKMPAIRQFLLHYQRSHADLAAIGGFKGLVMEGRDIGLNIFPETPLKYFFTADPQIKRSRRANEGILDIVDKRDLIDSTQGQFRQAKGAEVVDTSTRTLDEVVDDLLKDIRAKLENRSE